MTDYIKKEDLLNLYDLGGLEVENAKVPLDVVIQNIKDMPSIDMVEIKKEGEWDMFDLISSAYYGKGMYFKQDNGTVYSRHSGDYMTIDEAISEFISLIDEENIAFVPSVTTAWADGEASTYVLRKKGKWQITDAYPHNVYCSECHKKFAQTHWLVWEDGSLPRNYCSNCGADMRERRSE